MIYKNTWLLTGTLEQIAIVKNALDKIYFPWEKLTMPQYPTEIGWRNLNTKEVSLARQHKDVTKGIIDGREYTFGIIYPHTGMIYIDNLLVQYPDAAKTTVSAEIAHAVDYFLPIEYPKRLAIMKLMQGTETDAEHAEHTWWEKLDYGAEYFGLMGEAFMQAFTVAYSVIPFNNSSFKHGIAITDGHKVREILGIERTDAKTYYRAGRSLYYHVRLHGKMKAKVITDITGLRPCTICIK